MSLDIPTDLSLAAVAAISETLRQLLADVFALYVKTKNFHWHMSGPHFRAQHQRLLDDDEQPATAKSMLEELFADSAVSRGSCVQLMTFAMNSRISLRQACLKFG